MQVIGDYHGDGYDHLKGLVPPEVTQFLFQGLKADIGPIAIRLSGVQRFPNLLDGAGDACRVHHDRHSCEHSLSLTVAYSDGKASPLDGERRNSEPSASVDPDFGGHDSAAIAMREGDAVLHQGVHQRHGRTSPDPDAWSAHLFLHWVDKDGPYRDHGFDKQRNRCRVAFSFS